MTIFTKIINQEIPSYKIAENEKFYAFLDIRPIKQGHTLVIPKVEVDYIFDLEDELLGEMHIFCKKVAKAIQQAIPCLRVGVGVVGLEVPHAHIHLVPLHDALDLDFGRVKIHFTPEQFEKTASKIRSFLDASLL